MDLNVECNREQPQWSETRWNGCWSPEQGVGLYLHMGRFRKDLEMWWVQTVAYLPGGRLAVGRAWGRCTDRDRVRVGGFELRQTESGWASSFDGVLQLTTIDELAAGVRGSSSPSALVRWEAEAEGASGVWDLYGGVQERQEFAGDTHIQQGFHTRGTLTVDGAEYRLDGVGFKDHSSGVRKWDGFGHHTFTLAVMPEFTVHEIVITSTAGDAMPPMGAVVRGEQQSPLTGAELAMMEDARGGPHHARLSVQDASGAELSFDVEVLHGLPMIITEENDNINGIDWELDGNPVVLFEGIARLLAADGTVGYGFFERSRRRNELTPPALS